MRKIRIFHFSKVEITSGLWETEGTEMSVYPEYLGSQPSIHPYIYPTIHLSQPFIYPTTSIYPTIHLSNHQSIQPSIYPTIHRPLTHSSRSCQPSISYPSILQNPAYHLSTTNPSFQILPIIHPNKSYQSSILTNLTNHPS